MTGLWRPGVLRDYSFIADGERGALVDPDGVIVWLCAPRWESPAIFSAVLGAGGGYAITPQDPCCVPGGYYEPGSLIWHSRWVSKGVTECREALARPADPHRCVVLRRVAAHEVPAKLTVTLDVRAAFGRHAMRDLRRQRSAWTGRSGPVWFRWSGASGARPDGDGRLRMTMRLRPGEHHDVVLEVSDQPLEDALPNPDAAWQSTEDAWHASIPPCDDLIAVRDTRHAYAVLTGLTASTGATVAAATTSLPERMAGLRNYDYRYSWIRDQCYVGLAVAEHGPHPLLEGAVRFVAGRLHADGPQLRPAYTAQGRDIPAEHNLRVPGYARAPARAGNDVTCQFQLDGLGEALQLLAAAARLDMAGPDEWQAADIAAGAIERRWHQADAGIWELDDHRWTHSRLACVAGLRAIAAAAAGTAGRHGGKQAAAWSALADRILADLADCVHATGRWQRSPSDARPDAALLLPGIRGVPAPGDSRITTTRHAVVRELSEDGFVYRFRHDARPLHHAEGAFLLCGFWMAQATSRCGDRVAAAHWFERSRSACGPAGLYAEEFDVRQRQLRGNLPQAFVHAGLLSAALELSRNGDRVQAGKRPVS
jgi:alpha,alpha-trehalase